MQRFAFNKKELDGMLRAICSATPNKSNLDSVILALTFFGAKTGLDKRHRLAHFIAQIVHESGNFRWDGEIWGPTPAQMRYEGRRDLGNVQRGDGSKFRGRGPIQCTGRANYRLFTAWVRKFIPDAPDFEQHPELLNTDPYEGLSAIWFWSTNDLDALADLGSVARVTRRINGGYNGLRDREKYYVRSALVLLGYKATDVRGFQRRARLTVDGIAGPITRKALHRHLVKAK